MLNNYFSDTGVNFIESSKTFQSSEQFKNPNSDAKTVICKKILSSLKVELDSLSIYIYKSQIPRSWWKILSY